MVYIRPLLKEKKEEKFVLNFNSFSMESSSLSVGLVFISFFVVFFKQPHISIDVQIDG